MGSARGNEQDSNQVDTDPQVSWPDLTKFVGQLNHDLRNHLNALELQSALLSELVTDPETKGEVKRLREMSGEMSKHLQRLSATLNRIQPRPMRYLASEFVEDVRAKLGMEKPEEATAVEWKTSLGEEAFEVDPHLIQEAVLELFANAFAHERAGGSIIFESRPAGQEIEFVLREPKTKFEKTTKNWGSSPLTQMRSGHYGLGLYRARRIFEAHHGTLQAQFDPEKATLSTTVSLPRLAA